jgi:hypothetical protein
MAAKKGGKMPSMQKNRLYARALAMLRNLDSQTTRLHKQLADPNFLESRARLEASLEKTRALLAERPKIGGQAEAGAWDALKTGMSILESRISEMGQAKLVLERKLAARKKATKKIRKMTRGRH